MGEGDKYDQNIYKILNELIAILFLKEKARMLSAGGGAEHCLATSSRRDWAPETQEVNKRSQV